MNLVSKLSRRAVAVRLATIALGALALPVLGGCHGTYSPLGTPLQGSYSGTWSLDSNTTLIPDQTGFATVNISPNGAVNGTFSSTTLEITNDFSGTINSVGNVIGSIVVNETTYTGNGTFSRSENGGIVGTLNVTTSGGTGVGTLTFDLDDVNNESL